MKNLSFALALALICISMFSCGEKSVVNPQNEGFKITTFSPVSGFIASEVTLSGENLEKDSIVSVSFGEQSAEILSRSSDSLIVVVPRIAVGKYDITVKTKTKSYVYDEQYEVLQQSILDDLTQIKNYSISVNGFRVSYERYKSWRGPNPENYGSSYDTLINTEFSKSYQNKQPIRISLDSNNKFKGYETIRDKYYENTYNILNFELDKNINEFKTIKFQTYSYYPLPYNGRYVDIIDKLQFDLTNVIFIINSDLTIITVKLFKDEIVSKLSNFSYYHSSSYKYNNGSAYNEGSETFLELLDLNDDAYIEIKFTK